MLCPAGVTSLLSVLSRWHPEQEVCEVTSGLWILPNSQTFGYVRTLGNQVDAWPRKTGVCYQDKERHQWTSNICTAGWEVHEHSAVSGTKPSLLPGGSSPQCQTLGNTYHQPTKLIYHDKHNDPGATAALRLVPVFTQIKETSCLLAANLCHLYLLSLKIKI